MMKNTTILTLVILSALSNSKLNAQGCSDAGVCSVGSSHVAGYDSSDVERAASSVSLTTSFGMGEQGTTVLQVIPELNIGILKNLSWQARIPFMSISGNLGDVSGIGDIVTGLNFELNKNATSNTSLYAGVKIPLSESNKQDKNRSLPMPYQVGLGTFDFLGGISHRMNNFQATIGYQHVLDNGNKNRFTRAMWSDNADAQKYFESDGFIRGNDASFKLEYHFDMNKVKIAPGVLAIYRLNKDQALDENFVHQDIKGSDGVTLNIVGNANYEIGKKSSLRAQLGFPVVVREVRADGLTRSLVFNLGYYINFN
ncbi:MAG: transporter [Bacteroidetes bacterium]|nr:transporter [Bacteroidota bacterium]